MSILSLFIAIYGTGCSSTASEATSSQVQPIEVIFDATAYSRISPEKLIEFMGEPDDIEDWNYDNGSKVYPVTTYYYNKAKLSFMIADESLIRATLEDSAIKFSDDAIMYATFGIPAPSTAKKYIDTGTAKRYQDVGGGIEDIWLLLDNDEITIAKFTYDVRYFE